MPIIKAQRLVLRPFVLADASFVQQYAGDYDIAYNTLNIPYPYELQQAESWINTHQQSYEDEVSLTLAIDHFEPTYLIGAIGLHNISRDHDSAELGYWIGKPFWNKGFCTEAAMALLKFAFEHYNLNRIFAQHFSHNPASGRVMQKLGMKHEGTLRQHVKKWGNYLDIEVYGILRHELYGEGL